MKFQALFSGALIIDQCREGGLALLSRAREMVREIFGEHPESLDSEEFRRRLDDGRRLLRGDSFQGLTENLLRELGAFGPDLRVDDLRLRAVSPGLQDLEAAAPVFYAHRDTWYGNPRCQVNVWLPLQAVDSNNSFRFYPDYFNRKIANDSARFRADQFRGFGSLEPAHSHVYPRALEHPRGKVYDVSMKPGELLLFSAAHLHRTLPNRTSKVRFSLDFRFYLENYILENRGAPDPDNESTGLMGYRSCG